MRLLQPGFMLGIGVVEEEAFFDLSAKTTVACSRMVDARNLMKSQFTDIRSSGVIQRKSSRQWFGLPSCIGQHKNHLSLFIYPT